MKTIIIELTDHQYKAMEHTVFSPEEWSKNAVENQCRKATDDIVGKYTKRALDEGVQIPNSRDLIIDDAFDRGWVTTLKQHDENINEGRGVKQ